MIYLDSAATSLQKPAAVRYAMIDTLERLSSPGRGGYDSAMDAADLLYQCRTELQELFNVPEPDRVVFTSSATHGLNIAVKSLVKPGDKVVISGYEHNAVTRPLRAIGAEIRTAESPLFQPEEAVAAFRRNLPGAKAAVCCHVSNVFGYILPIEEIAATCYEAGVPLIVDASQSAGTIPLDFSALKCAFAAMPGHKGLLGPQGTGVLLCGSDLIQPIMEGGTGSDSASWEMPDYLPDRLEAGTHNMPGIAGLFAGVRWVKKNKEKGILSHELEMLDAFIGKIGNDRRIKLYRSADRTLQSGVISVVTNGMDCEEAAMLLGAQGIAVRAGLHCAPLAHRTAGTFETGTIRFSFSPFTKREEVSEAADAILQIA